MIARRGVEFRGTWRGAIEKHNTYNKKAAYNVKISCKSGTLVKINSIEERQKGDGSILKVTCTEYELLAQDDCLVSPDFAKLRIHKTNPIKSTNFQHHKIPNILVYIIFEHF